MPRIVGQVDETKTEAILDAAANLFAEKGIATSMDAIARHAGVSKQTLYNRFASKTDLARALAGRRSEQITAPLRSGGEPETVLAAFAASLIEGVGVHKRAWIRSAALMSPHTPGVAEAVYDAGPAEGLRRLSAWLADQDRQGRVCIPDPDAAAEMFAGMVLGHSHLRAVLGIVPPEMATPQQRAKEVTHRFLRAFAPDHSTRP